MWNQEEAVDDPFLKQIVEVPNQWLMSPCDREGGSLSTAFSTIGHGILQQ